VDSDGSYKKDRISQIEFSTTSENLSELFQVLGALNGFDAHVSTYDSETICVTAYSAKTRTSLESRAQYHGKEQYSGTVYCATTSTGWLIVRGDETEFAFICGNTSPFEQVQFKFRVKAPLLVWWQWIRHRTFHYQSINSQSGRYTPFREDEFYFPREWRLQSADNKQGSAGVISEQRERLIYARATLNFPDNHWLATEFLRDEDEDDPTLSQVLARYNRLGYQIYEKLLESGVAKEQARLFLPGFGVYYTWVLSVDALNLMNFLRLRMADDAQWEIRQYADIIYKEMFKPLLPWTSSAFEKYILNIESDEND
jgi:flavin-dependent thymidylate synthase